MGSSRKEGGVKKLKDSRARDVYPTAYIQLRGLLYNIQPCALDHYTPLRSRGRNKNETKEEFKSRYEKELEKKLKKFKTAEELELEGIETWEQRAKR